METAKECEKRLALTISQTNESIATILQSEENTMTIPQNNENVEKINVELLSSTTLSELKQKILRKFLLVKGMCRQCYSEKILPKKFFAENNMDPGEISHELEGLTEIEKMLIVQYYANITIDNEVLESLPQEGYIDNQLPHLQADQEDDDLNNENDYEEVTHSFVPLLPPNNHKEVAINSTLDRIESKNLPILWLQIDNSPINKFQTLGYILRAFPTLYPKGCANFMQNGLEKFGFPKDNYGQTFLCEDNRREPELVMARNNLYINPHSALTRVGVTQTGQFTKSTYLASTTRLESKCRHKTNPTALQYISKYASKVEPCSATFSEILNQIISNSRSDGSVLPVAQKLLIHSIAECGILAQETCHLLLGIPLYHLSRSFIFLNLNKESPRWLRGTEKINLDGMDLLGPLVNKIVDEIIEEDSGKEIEDEKEELQLDWMQLAGMGPNAIINCFSEFGSCNIDINFDWVNNAKKHYSNNELTDVDTFLYRTSSSSRLEGSSNVITDTVNYLTLNKKQKQVFKDRIGPQTIYVRLYLKNS
ncbi:hypothetical protein C2G38_2207276 [Gigaspora rosea]|uniref:Uncharacterized protein n=1 Tax=Gigaspora rosea TaxID=44941 RepID=A0A397US55_9GLOM|nr:hypothetical protein C2G38_2207276 [Gigaspora rosea]